MNGLEMILSSFGIDFGDVEKKITEITDLAKDKLDRVDSRLARIEKALGIEGTNDDNGNC